MSEADVDWDILAFRQWAAQRWPARATFIRDGELDFDYFADAFRAGAAASVERLKELEAEVRELEEALNATPSRVFTPCATEAEARALLKESGR